MANLDCTQITWAMVSNGPEPTDAPVPPPAPELHEYAFDVKLFAVVRVVAADLPQAIATMETVIDAMSPTSEWVSGFNGNSAVKITEVSLAEDGESENRVPFEVDGADQDDLDDSEDSDSEG